MTASSYADCATCQATPFHSGGYEQLVTALEIGHDRKAHRIYNNLYWEGIRSGRRLAQLTDAELLQLKDIGPRALERIRMKLAAPSSETLLARAKSEPSVLRLAALQVRANLQGALDTLGLALAAALEEAAEDYECCARRNARRLRNDLPEIPNPVAVAVYTAALVYVRPALSAPAAHGDQEARGGQPAGARPEEEEALCDAS